MKYPTQICLCWIEEKMKYQTIRTWLQERGEKMGVKEWKYDKYKNSYLTFC